MREPSKNKAESLLKIRKELGLQSYLPKELNSANSLSEFEKKILGHQRRT
jgi:hypothetical protein